MVKRRFLRSFLRDESGISLTEAMLTFPIVMLVFAAFVEFGYAMFQWNQTAKALQYGARLAAVSDSLVLTFDPDGAAAAPAVTDVGNSMPVGGTWTCGPNKANCDTVRLGRIVDGTAARPGMADLNWRITADDVIVTYELSGLGYYGRPNGAVVTLRMEVSGVTFDLPILGALLGLDEIEIPLMPVTITSEDLDTTPGA